MRAVARIHLIIFFMQIQEELEPEELESDGNPSVSGATALFKIQICSRFISCFLTLWTSRKCKKHLTTTQMCGMILLEAEGWN